MINILLLLLLITTGLLIGLITMFVVYRRLLIKYNILVEYNRRRKQIEHRNELTSALEYYNTVFKDDNN